MFDWCHIWNMVCAHQKKFLISACSNFRSCWIPRSSSHINVYSPNLVLPPSAFRGSNAHYGQPGPVCHSASRLSLVSIWSLLDNTGFFSLMRWKPTLLSTTGTLDHQQDLRPTSTGFFKALVGSVSSVSDLYLTLQRVEAKLSFRQQGQTIAGTIIAGHHRKGRWGKGHKVFFLWTVLIPLYYSNVWQYSNRLH